MSVKTVREMWEMACPKCGADDEIDIAATVGVLSTSNRKPPLSAGDR